MLQWSCIFTSSATTAFPSHSCSCSTSCLGSLTNLFGGWIASRSGVKVTLYGGLALQIFALLMLARLNPHWSEAVSVAYVMAAQAMSGIAKDLTKMSAKSAIKVIVPDGADGALFKWVARLTGSKNALKGVGFFVGGALLAAFGFAGALVGMAGALVVVLLATVACLSGDLGRSKKKVKFTSLFSKSSEINWLSAARLFLFASRDVWFVVGLPVFLSQLGWSFYSVGAFLALWVIGYGFIQAAVPEILRTFGRGDTVDGAAARLWAFVLLVVPVGLVVALRLGINPGLTRMVGLGVFAVVFAVNSAIHSYLVLAYTDEDSVALNVGFYYMATRLAGVSIGTLLSGVVFQFAGFPGLPSRGLPHSYLRQQFYRSACPAGTPYRSWPLMSAAASNPNRTTRVLLFGRISRQTAEMPVPPGRPTADDT